MTSNKGRALVTGGAGLVGSHLADLLIESGHEVTILDNLEPQTHPQGKPPWLHPEAYFIKGDIRDREVLHKALKEVRFVFHQAAFGGFTTEISKYFDVNVQGTTRLFELISSGKYKVEKVVIASSQAVYAEGAYQCSKEGVLYPPVRSFEQLQMKQWEVKCPHCGLELQAVPTSEEKIKSAETPYALSKELEERLSLSQGRHLNLPVVALRYGVVYGPRQSIFNPYTGVVSIFSTRILNDLPPLVYEDGSQTRDFIFVKDVAKANLTAMERTEADFQILNVGTGKATTISNLTKELSRLYRKQIEPEIAYQFRRGDVRHIVLDPGKFTRLGFQAVTGLSQGLRHFTDWMMTQENIEDRFTAAYRKLKENRFIYD